MRKIGAVLLSLSLVACAGQAGTPAPPSSESSAHVSVLSVEALRAMEKIAGKDPATLHDPAALSEWARARLAWVSLARLQGREEEALRVFARCEQVCREHGPEAEWKTARAWACAKRRDLEPCRSAAGSKGSFKAK